VEWKLELVPVPVTDVDRAKEFYADRVGFHLDFDHRSGDMRIVQLTPPGSACSIALGVSGAPPGSAQGLQLVVRDVDAARAELAARGVDVSPVRHLGPDGWADGRGEEWNSFLFFGDPDGNTWTV